MAFFLRPLFLRLLLLCVMLNLGDAPYVDELMAEMSQDLVVGSQFANDAGHSKVSKDEAGQQKVKHSVYDELISLVAMPMQQQQVFSFAEPGQDLPDTVRWLPLSACPSFIEKPPRLVATA